jgi:regulator of protease activity HflC (stomatin/prohibitin superfamily)
MCLKRRARRLRHAPMSRLQNSLRAINEIAQSAEFEQFTINAQDFLSARERGEAAGTRIDEMVASLGDASEITNRSFPQQEQTGQWTNVISPVVVPKSHRSFGWVFWVVVLAVVGVIGSVSTNIVDNALGGTDMSSVLFGPHYWLLLLAYAGFSLWRQSYVMVPDGCQALITRFGKLEAVVGPGRTVLLNPWKRVSYIVNTTKEYPYNAPIREAPTASRVNASVDLFLQFKIEDPAAFIFSLGGVKGFAEKLQNAISEVTRALIYEQKAEDIYDLVGESTQMLLESLNQQFLPAVRFVNANITHAEPSSQDYRMDLAAPEMVRVAKEAYTYEYELKLRKEQDEGDIAKELASLTETLSAIRAEIATYQAQSDVAHEREVDRANAYARRLMTEAESVAKANAALLEAQALDLRAVSAAAFPEILQYRFQQDVLERIESVAGRLPQIVQVGGAGGQLDYPAIAREMLGIDDEPLYAENDLQAIRQRLPEIRARIEERGAQLKQMKTVAEQPIVTPPIAVQPAVTQPAAAQPAATQHLATEGVSQ